MQVVGDDFQVVVIEQCPGNGLGGRPDIDKIEAWSDIWAAMASPNTAFFIAHLIGARMA